MTSKHERHRRRERSGREPNLPVVSPFPIENAVVERAIGVMGRSTVAIVERVVAVSRDLPLENPDLARDIVGHMLASADENYGQVLFYGAVLTYDILRQAARSRGGRLARLTISDLDTFMGGLYTDSRINDATTPEFAYTRFRDLQKEEIALAGGIDQLSQKLGEIGRPIYFRLGAVLVYGAFKTKENLKRPEPKDSDMKSREEGENSSYFPLSAEVVSRVVAQVHQNGQKVIAEEYSDWLENDRMLYALNFTNTQLLKMDNVAAGAYRTGLTFVRKMIKDQAAVNGVVLPPLSEETFLEYNEQFARRNLNERVSEIVASRIAELKITEPHLVAGIESLSQVGFARTVPMAFQLGAIDMYDSRCMEIEKRANPRVESALKEGLVMTQKYYQEQRMKRPPAMISGTSQEDAELWRKAAEEKGLTFKILGQPGDSFENMNGEITKIDEGNCLVQIDGKRMEDFSGLWERVEELEAQREIERQLKDLGGEDSTQR